jgi:hypothetical protein
MQSIRTTPSRSSAQVARSPTLLLLASQPVFRREALFVFLLLLLPATPAPAFLSAGISRACAGGISIASNLPRSTTAFELNASVGRAVENIL